jgi:hypothetical protein
MHQLARYLLEVVVAVASDMLTELIKHLLNWPPS